MKDRLALFVRKLPSSREAFWYADSSTSFDLGSKVKGWVWTGMIGLFQFAVRTGKEIQKGTTETGRNLSRRSEAKVNSLLKNSRSSWAASPGTWMTANSKTVSAICIIFAIFYSAMCCTSSAATAADSASFVLFFPFHFFVFSKQPSQNQIQYHATRKMLGVIVLLPMDFIIPASVRYIAYYCWCSFCRVRKFKPVLWHIATATIEPSVHSI